MATIPLAVSAPWAGTRWETEPEQFTEPELPIEFGFFGQGRFSKFVNSMSFVRTFKEAVSSSDRHRRMQAAIDSVGWDFVKASPKFLQSKQWKTVEPLLPEKFKEKMAHDKKTAVKELNDVIEKGTCYGTSLSCAKLFCSKDNRSCAEMAYDIACFQIYNRLSKDLRPAAPILENRPAPKDGEQIKCHDEQVKRYGEQLDDILYPKSLFTWGRPKFSEGISLQDSRPQTKKMVSELIKKELFKPGVCCAQIGLNPKAAGKMGHSIFLGLKGSANNGYLLVDTIKNPKDLNEPEDLNKNELRCNLSSIMSAFRGIVRGLSAISGPYKKSLTHTYAARKSSEEIIEIALDRIFSGYLKTGGSLRIGTFSETLSTSR